MRWRQPRIATLDEGWLASCSTMWQRVEGGRHVQPIQLRLDVLVPWLGSRRWARARTNPRAMVHCHLLPLAIASGIREWKGHGNGYPHLGPAQRSRLPKPWCHAYHRITVRKRNKQNGLTIFNYYVLGLTAFFLAIHYHRARSPQTVNKKLIASLYIAHILIHNIKFHRHSGLWVVNVYLLLSFLPFSFDSRSLGSPRCHLILHISHCDWTNRLFANHCQCENWYGALCVGAHHESIEFNYNAQRKCVRKS